MGLVSKDGSFVVNWYNPCTVANFADYSDMLDLIKKNVDLYIRSMPKDDVSIISLVSSKTPVLAKILWVGNNGVDIQPTPEYKFILEDLQKQDKLVISPCMISRKITKLEKNIIIGLRLNIILDDGTVHDL